MQRNCAICVFKLQCNVHTTSTLCVLENALPGVKKYHHVGAMEIGTALILAWRTWQHFRLLRLLYYAYARKSRSLNPSYYWNKLARVTLKWQIRFVKDTEPRIISVNMWTTRYLHMKGRDRKQNVYIKCDHNNFKLCMTSVKKTKPPGTSIPANHHKYNSIIKVITHLLL